MTLSAGAASSSAFKPKRKEMITSGIGALGLAIDVVRKRTLFNQTRIQPKKLTPREEEILGWLGQCKDGPTVALILGIGSKTVEYHLANAMRKLEVNNRAELVREAIRLGLCECPCPRCTLKAVAA